MHPRILLLAACALALVACSDSDSTAPQGTRSVAAPVGGVAPAATTAPALKPPPIPARAAGQGARLLPDGFHQRPGARGDERGPAAGAREPDEADERVRGVPRAQGRPHQARRPGAHQPARARPGRLAHVRRGRHAGQRREPDPGHDRAVRQRRDRRARRARRRQRAGVRRPDESVRAAARHREHAFPEQPRHALARALHDCARHRACCRLR